MLQKASLGLSPAALTLLENSIAQISTDGGTQIKPPTVGTSTDNTRPALASQLQNLFGSSKIQVPNYAGNPATTGETAATETLEAFNEKRKEQEKRFNAQFEIANSAKLAMVDAINTLPAGDPTIAELRKKFADEYLKAMKISEELLT